MTRPGNRSRIFSPAASATPGFAPSKNTLFPSRPICVMSAAAKSMPGSFARSGVPRIFAP